MSVLHAIGIALICLAAGTVAAEPDVRPVSAATLRSDLLQLSRTFLAPVGLSIDVGHVQLATSRPLADGERFSARPLWFESSAAPPLPLVFELRSLDGSEIPVRATLSVALQREVLALRRRVERGAPLVCDDVEVSSKPLRLVPTHALQPPCELPSNAQMRRVLLAGEVLRQGDARVPPEVVAQASVNVRVKVGRIVLEKVGTALADARKGESVRVRLNGGGQVLRGRVVAHNTVVMEGSE